MDPFLTYIISATTCMRQIADNQCYLQPQCTVDTLLAWYQAPHWGKKEKKIGVGKKKISDPAFFAFLPHCGACVELCSVELLAWVLEKPGW